MTLFDLLAQSGVSSSVMMAEQARLAAVGLVVKGLTSDSRQVQAGFLFVVFGTGGDYSADALRRGAQFLLVHENWRGAYDDSVIVLRSSNPRRSFAFLCAAWFGFRQPSCCVAVTGTNGKTSVAEFVRQLWCLLGFSASSWGTLDVLKKGREYAALTTADAYDVHRRLADQVDSGGTHAIIEASSHGLAQHRLDAVRLRVAAFTNISRDHLDYHKDMASYFAAKRRLFSDVLPEETTAVFNGHDRRVMGLATLLIERGIRLLSYGVTSDCSLYADSIQHSGEHLSFRLHYGGQEGRFVLPLIGRFQLMNVLCACGIVIAAGAQVDSVWRMLGRLRGVVGRMECVARLTNTHESRSWVYVDFAHTPQGLEHALKALRQHFHKAFIWIVFGCGGMRDKGKRPLMGQCASRYADGVMITDDNPRQENPAMIRKQIRQGITETTKPIYDCAERQDAIALALKKSQESADNGGASVVLIAGKGHEQGQIVAERVLPFDDRAVVRDVCAKQGGWEVLA